jgi:peptidoglycan/LPS O-acetylase OafA/YrhL
MMIALPLRRKETPMSEVIPDGQISAGKILLVEYEMLKQEQQRRIGFRDNLIYATLTAMAAMTAATLRSTRPGAFIMILPAACLALGWTYLVNDQHVSAIGRYLREELRPRLLALLPDGVSVFDWERAHRADRRRRSRKHSQLVVDLGLFCLSGCVALVLYWSTGLPPAPLLVVSIIELGAIVWLGVQFIVYADLRREL